MIWVDSQFIKEGIRQQRQKRFEYNIVDSGKITIINDDMTNIYVNGLQNKSIAKKIIQKRVLNHTQKGLQNINHSNFSFLKIETNSFIGNPN